MNAWTDTTLENNNTEAADVLSYDQDISYEEQVSSISLASRIGSSKVYLLSENSSRATKRKHGEEDDVSEFVEDIDMEDSYGTARPNAIVLHGPPIAHLPTARIFAYTTHFDVHPVGLEWVNDLTCILVFDTISAAKAAFCSLQKLSNEPAPPYSDGSLVDAKSIPVTLWPPEERVNKTLGKETALQGQIGLRWAQKDDVKRPKAKQESEFYRKHGETAGKVSYEEERENATKRRRRNSTDEAAQKAKLDDDLDAFLAQGDGEEEPDNTPVTASPPSKMRSDYISSDGRTLLERTSLLRAHDTDIPIVSHHQHSRSITPLPRRSRQHASQDLGDVPRSRRSRDNTSATGADARKTGQRPKKTQQELDDELDAFLNERN